MNSKALNFSSVWFLVFVLALATTPATAQLPQDLKDVFEGMLDDLDEDLREKFQKAIDDKTAEVEFTAEQFRRFQKHPINPFEGIASIEPDDVDGNVILKFELPSMRNRRVSAFERQHAYFLNGLNPVVGSAGVSTVAIKSDGRQIALGVVVQSDGLVLTKASELKNKDQINCDFGSGATLAAQVIKTDKKNDLAVLKVDANNLVPVRWSDEKPLLGSFLLTMNEKRNVVSLGSYSVIPRSTAIGKRALLGVRPETTANGVRIGEITRETAAWAAGLRDGDVITKFDGVVMRDVSQLVNQIRKHQPGDEIQIEYLRGTTAEITTASLAALSISGERAAEFKMMNRLGAVPSRKADGFPFVFQHDTPLFPEQCGGPVVDLRGNVVGINIARNGRAATYAIPASHLKVVLAEMLQADVAAQNRNSEVGGKRNRNSEVGGRN